MFVVLPLTADLGSSGGERYRKFRSRQLSSVGYNSDATDIGSV